MNNDKRSGYTLIEVLVGLTIIGLIFSFGFVSFRDFARRQALASAARALRGDLRLAQGQALAGKKPSDIFCNSPNTLDGVNFRVVSSSNYVFETSCTGGNVEIKSVDLSSDITISTPSPNPILFRVLGHGTNIASGDVTITLTQTSSSATADIIISANGEIN